MFCEERTNMNLDEKRETKSLINYTHMVSRNTSQEEIVCWSLKRPPSWRRVHLRINAAGLVACIKKKKEIRINHTLQSK